MIKFILPYTKTAQYQCVFLSKTNATTILLKYIKMVLNVIKIIKTVLKKY